MIMLSKCPDESNENDEFKGHELNVSDCILFSKERNNNSILNFIILFQGKISCIQHV